MEVKYEIIVNLLKDLTLPLGTWKSKSVMALKTLTICWAKCLEVGISDSQASHSVSKGFVN